MNVGRLYKIASVLLFLFAIGHTTGLLKPKSFGKEGDEVFAAMHTVPVHVMGSNHTFWDFYVGFGLLVSILFVFTGVWAWQLSSLWERQREAVKALAWPFFLCQTAVAVLCGTNFFLVPIVFSVLISLSTGLAAYKTRG
jgi:cytochrome bd-type quinol oxidase subunit 1